MRIAAVLYLSVKCKIFIETKVSAMKVQGFNLEFDNKIQILLAHNDNILLASNNNYEKIKLLQSLY